MELQFGVTQQEAIDRMKEVAGDLLFQANMNAVEVEKLRATVINQAGQITEQEQRIESLQTQVNAYALKERNARPKRYSVTKKAKNSPG